MYVDIEEVIKDNAFTCCHRLIQLHAISCDICSLFSCHCSFFWAAAPKGRCPVGHRGEPLRTSVRTYVPPPEAPLRPQISPLKPKISPLRPKISRLRPKISSSRPLISLVRTDVRNGSPLCPTGHRPFGAAALLSHHFFSYHSKQGIGYR